MWDPYCLPRAAGIVNVRLTGAENEVKTGLVSSRDSIRIPHHIIFKT